MFIAKCDTVLTLAELSWRPKPPMHLFAFKLPFEKVTGFTAEVVVMRLHAQLAGKARQATTATSAAPVVGGLASKATE